jgi:predicted glycosyltransferase
MSADAVDPRLLIYSQDGLGLGHQRRTTLLAGEFLDSCPGSSVLTISDSPIGQFFEARPGHDYLKLPSIRKVGPGSWQPVSLSQPFEDVLKMRKEIIRSAALAFRPDVLLVDHMPHGAMGELVPTLEELEGSGTRIVLGLRDILDAPATVRQRWRLEGAFEAVERFFEDVLVYGSRDLFDVAAQYGWPTSLAARLRYCGYVCAPPALSGVDAVRHHYLGDDQDARLVVAMAGGGADSATMFTTLLRALPSLDVDHRVVVVLVTGPFLPEEERARLQLLVGDLPVHLIPTVSDSPSYLGAADLVVAMAGYNTTAEILSLGARALLVPRSGPSAEQQMRARSFAHRGWVRWIQPDILSPETLAAAMASALDTPPASVSMAPDLLGRQRAAGHLLNGWARQPGGGAGSLVMSTVMAPPLEDSRQLLGEG